MELKEKLLNKLEDILRFKFDKVGYVYQVREYTGQTYNTDRLDIIQLKDVYHYRAVIRDFVNDNDYLDLFMEGLKHFVDVSYQSSLNDNNKLDVLIVFSSKKYYDYIDYRNMLSKVENAIRSLTYDIEVLDW
jgi:hypothetical protein